MFKASVGTLKIIRFIVAVCGCGMLLASLNAQAVPAYARQTGENCLSCHISFPELTPFGRLFKLSGYTLGKRQSIPLAGMIQASMTSTKETGGDSNITGADFPRNNEVVLQQASVFLAGKFTDHLGTFTQWTYDGVAHASQIDNTDIRLTDNVETKDMDLMYGATLHNNPTVQDVWNTTPAFGYPYASSSVAVTPAASTLIDGNLGSQVAGLGGYFYWKKTLYGELTAYRTADGAFSVFRAGTDKVTPGAIHALDGYNPYWRLALTHDWGPNSAMIGTYGMVANVYPDDTNPTGPTNRFKDYALDAQYQYITEPHTFTAQVTWIHENVDWNGDLVIDPASHDNSSSNLKTFRAKASYYRDRKYGGTLSYFSTTGDTDTGLYQPGAITGSANGSPDSRGYIVELDYVPWQQFKLAAQYTAYTKFNGGSTNYDGSGRNASDNNTFYLLGWFMF